MTRQEAAEHAFRFYLDAVEKGRLGFCNLAYRHFWKIFEEKNDDVLEKENDSEIIIEFVTEQLIFSRAVLDNGHQSLIRKIIREMTLESKALRGWALAKVLSHFSYRDQAKLMLYSWLTVLRRIRRNTVQEISKFPNSQLAEMFNFNLADDDVLFESEQRKWIQNQIEQKREDLDRQAESLAVLLDISKEQALRELRESEESSIF